ncbi:MAG: ParB/RepB/Spo0J family partition protein, partial [Fimbriimonadaceae bacterium]
LGKGLSQLIGEQAELSQNEVAIDAIVPNQRQPRQNFDEEALRELADSIRQVGILQPLVVRPLSEGKYELIAGERRLRAAQLAGLERVPVTIRAAGHQDSLEIALIENVQREDISPLEQARAYRRLIDEFGLTQEQVADKVGKSRTAVANTVRLLRLPPAILEGLQAGKITEGHARALLAIPSEVLQLALYDKILRTGMTVRDVEKAAQAEEVRQPSRRRKPSRADSAADPQWQPLEEAVSTYFGAPTRLIKSEVGGKIEIEFYSDDDLMRILDVLGIHL